MGEEKRPEAEKTEGMAAKDVAQVLGERGWTGNAKEEPPDELRAWTERAALLLGRKVNGREELSALLELVFHYDAEEILGTSDAHIVLGRAGARTVIRELGREVLAGGAVDSERLKEIFERVKERTEYRGRELFHPLRLALAGRAGEGELDRVVLLLDEATKLPFATPVKGTHERMLEFCARLD